MDFYNYIKILKFIIFRFYLIIYNTINNYKNLFKIFFFQIINLKNFIYFFEIYLTFDLSILYLFDNFNIFIILYFFLKNLKFIIIKFLTM